jgi:hypothetical protein
MTRPAGYLVTRSDRTTALIKDEASAIEKAALGRGTLTKLFSAEQIAAAVEEHCSAIDGDDIAAFIRSLGDN